MLILVLTVSHTSFWSRARKADFLCFIIWAVNADAVLKGTNVDGVYDCHHRNSNMQFEHISFRELDARGISAMDMTAVSFCEENGIPGWFFAYHLPYYFIWYQRPINVKNAFMNMAFIMIFFSPLMAVVLFNLLEPGNISRALCGEQVGTLVDQSGRIS